MKICFILYKPAVPGNVGAAARALKTMGFDELRLIDPCDYKSEEAFMLAHGSHDVLLNARVYSDYDSAVSDLDFVVGTTAKKRRTRTEFLSPSKLVELFETKGKEVSNVGILFGTEESGLPNEILKKCDIASSIPLKTPYPSLNLGQAVMLYAYELSGIAPKHESSSEVIEESLAELKKRSSDILVSIGITPDMPIYNRILERISMMNRKDSNLLHSVTARLVDFLTNDMFIKF